MIMVKKIAVFHTGGTIAMKQDNETGAVKPQESNPLLQTDSALFQNVELITENILNVPSPHITEQEMLQLQKAITKKTATEHFDGIVITHGTDTLEETAYFLDLTIPHDIPIVITGAMRSSNELGSDGLHNFISAVKVAMSDKAKNAGVMVVLNEEIHAARNVTKTHTSNVATFQSPQFGPVGIVTKNGVFFYQKLLRHEQYDIQQISKNIILLKAFAGMNELLFEALNDIPIHGLVIEALGQGNLPPKTVSGLKKLMKKGIPVVLVSRCFNGIAEDVYGYEGGGKQLKELGMIFSNGLNGQKARIKLMVCLEASNNHQELEKMFAN